MKYPLVLDLAADGIAVAVTCRVLGFSKQAFYAWMKNPISQRDWDEAHLINAALGIHADDPAFGYRFIADELPARGIAAGENKVARLCSQQRIWSAFSKQRGLSRKAGPPVHDDLVARKFTADGPDRLWLTDITEHPTAEGKLYLCAIKDVYSNRITGYSMDSRMTAQLAVAALHNAIALRSPAGTVVLHSGRGSQFRSAAFVKDAQGSRPDRLDGQGRRLRRQRRHGIVLRPAAKERPGPPALAKPRPVAPGDHYLDRADLPPKAPATSAWKTHTHRIRDNQPGRTRSLNHPAPESTKDGAVPLIYVTGWVCRGLRLELARERAGMCWFR